jgi:hypothetical protein
MATSRDDIFRRALSLGDRDRADLVAALVDAELFARIRRMRERFDALCTRIAESYAEVPLEEGLAEIDAAVAAERKPR